ncbi:MAG: hypothetical protein Q8R82_11920, partial [Hyphomonadaceae bacterium]|nr:hypothetical protein [Hyphomonadaceae bacterium]
KKLGIADIQSLKDVANQTARKSLHAILQSKILDKVSVKTFEKEAAALNIALTVAGGKMELPTDPKDLRDVLNFLQNKVYEGPLDKQIYVANAKRRLKG